MGCDIHVYVEAWKGDEPTSEYGFTALFPRIHLGRDYYMFARLANVRGDHKNALPLRGLPVVIGYMARNDNTIYVSKDEGKGERFALESMALRWIESGSSKVIWTRDDGTIGAVTDPDWHSHTWLTPEEWDAAIFDRESERDWPLAVEYHIISDMMHGLRRRGHNSRVVFWFDN